MRTPARLAPSCLALAFASCAPSAPPLHVPGPTTAHPPGYSLAEGPLPAASPVVPTVALRAPGMNVVALRVVFASGSADDPPGKEGLTRLTATTMAEGGTRSLSYSELIEKLYPLAASINVHVDRDETVFSAEVSRDSLPEFVVLFEAVLLAPRLGDDSFDRVRAQTTSALTDDLRGANDEALGKEALEAFVYQGHPYGHPALGTEHGLASSSLADVKEQRARVFCRDRMTIGVAGGFPEGFDAVLAHDLGMLPACQGERTALPLPKKLSGFQVLIVDKPSADATAISMGRAYDVTRASPDFAAVTFFTDHLGLHRQSSGRLFQELREKRGLNYGDYAYAEHFEQDGGSRFPLPNIIRRQELFSMWLRPVKSANALFALHAALREYDAALAHPISDAEIDRYRTFLTRYTALEELTPSRRLGYALDDHTYGFSHPYLEMMHDAWKTLSEATLGAAAERHLGAGDMAIVLVAKDGAALARSLIEGTAVKPPVYESPKPKSVTDADAEILAFPVPVSKENVRVVSVADLFKE